MSNKAKGARRERQARDFYVNLFDGACRVVKAGASLGEADLCVFPLQPEHKLILSQIKSNAWPSPRERRVLEQLAEALPLFCVPAVEIVRYDDRKPVRRLRWTPLGWAAVNQDGGDEPIVLEPQDDL